MALAELGVNPISADKPAGEDVRYDSQFEEVQAEIDKLSIASVDGEGIHWNQVVKLATSILREKSKDLQVAIYLAVALINTSQFEGFADGTEVIQELVANFWDSMYPPKKRMRGRLNAVNWWMEQTENFLKNYQPGPLPHDLVQRARQSVNDLDQALAEKADDAPILRRLLDYLDRLPVAPVEEQAEAPAKEPAGEQPEPAAAPSGDQAEASATPEPAPEAAEKEPPAEPAPPAPQPSAPKPAAPAPSPRSPVQAPADMDSDRDATQAVQAGLDLMLGASAFLMKQDLSSPLAYRINRIAAWLTVDSLPITEGDRTLLPPPEPRIRSGLDRLAADREFADLIQTAEARAGEFLFWLDMSRLTADALTGLGDRYAAARAAVEVETAAFVQRLPGLEALCFSDGTPFADKETRAWLKAVTRTATAAAADDRVAIGGDGGSRDEVGDGVPKGSGADQGPENGGSGGPDGRRAQPKPFGQKPAVVAHGSGPASVRHGAGDSVTAPRR